MAEIAHIPSGDKENCTLAVMNLLSRHKQLIPVLILTLLSIWTAFRIIFTKTVVGDTVTTYDFIPAHYFGFIAVAVCIFTYFVFRKAYKVVLGATLVLGIFSVLIFTLSAHIFELGMGALAVSFEPFSFCVSLLVVALNGNRISEMIRKNFPAKTQETIKDEFESDLRKYKAQYRHSSSEELQKVVNDARFKPGAIEAARQVLKERVK